MEVVGIRKINSTVKSLISPAPTLKNLKERNPIAKVANPRKRFVQCRVSNHPTIANRTIARLGILCFLKSKIAMKSRMRVVTIPKG